MQYIYVFDVFSNIRTRDTITLDYGLRSPLVELRINEGESFEGFLRRFTKRVQQESIISEARRRQHFEPPSITRKKTAAAKKRKSMKATLKNM
ncbi:MAG: 30S ribosomal protein S21 [SAR202 cluster bacterium]|nr:30S ribosomal protein S21 [Chloroflexota bacterium]MQG88327.1 30S ribosomal protein S21 [SAR202 cluster bacterium]|tara:strand:- start:75 stop:353 length:279 start_codon:yes stop_codon:yes gene_type:complete